MTDLQKVESARGFTLWFPAGSEPDPSDGPRRKVVRNGR